MSERGDPMRLDRILAEAKGTGIESPLEAGRVWSRWNDIVGADIARHAQPSSLRRGVLRVRADSPAWATEIAYLGPQIATRANEVAGAPIVREVSTWTGPRRDEPVAMTPGGVAAKSPDTAAGTPFRPASTDPVEAVERARRSWLRRRAGGTRGARR